ncbi:2,3-diphosphoglycerate-dependent phosphoglycerate mutase [Patescibacteria group bacterium]|nr:2,3-diphosphoglycerate-dependent phosphoglycerate mutase [Patescibacteria group bacterium]MDE1946566.1 2,3-diphosphoglycerate-dependent phosphoglycerate mutase [Patescibacteria group bacterium]MDE2010873.1 2,3-diphosphoglycerate-dependent phosphoglycerate mutase [Patescibacteria group bacterium]MDE2232757.1 2,3-diphosphoglycerate-dependent phosphoglycerate mutase [Patescibacteria group bacterium]
MKKLVLLRHGESVWNKENRFTGWTDVDLSEKGVEEAHEAGKKLKEAHFHFDIVFASVLKRVTRTMEIVLEEMGLENIEIRKSWKLNERHYGALQGLNKSETARKYGEEQVKMWRRSYDTPIPPLPVDSPMYPGNDPLYKDLGKSEIPLSETLKNVVENRIIPYWNEEIAPAVKLGKMVLIVASGNSLRGLVKIIEGISDLEIAGLDIPTGIPIIYDLNDDLKPVKKYYLAAPDKLKKAVQTVENQGKS